MQDVESDADRVARALGLESKADRAHGGAGLERLMGVDEVAEVLAMKPTSVYELARKGLVPHVRIGRSVRFLPSQLRAFLESGGQALPGGWRAEPR